jgi:hypothetical protein
MKAQPFLAPLVIAAMFEAGCGRCAQVSSAKIRPGDDIALHLNETATAEYWLTGRCGYSPTMPTRLALRWSTADTLVVSVEPVSGLIRAIGLGDARVSGYSSDAPTTPTAEILVHVR